MIAIVSFAISSHVEASDNPYLSDIRQLRGLLNNAYPLYDGAQELFIAAEEDPRFRQFLNHTFAQDKKFLKRGVQGKKFRQWYFDQLDIDFPDELSPFGTHPQHHVLETFEALFRKSKTLGHRPMTDDEISRAAIQLTQQRFSLPSEEILERVRNKHSAVYDFYIGRLKKLRLERVFGKQNNQKVAEKAFMDWRQEMLHRIQQAKEANLKSFSRFMYSDGTIGLNRKKEGDAVKLSIEDFQASRLKFNTKRSEKVASSIREIRIVGLTNLFRFLEGKGTGRKLFRPKKLKLPYANPPYVGVTGEYQNVVFPIELDSVVEINTPQGGPFHFKLNQLMEEIRHNEAGPTSIGNRTKRNYQRNYIREIDARHLALSRLEEVLRKSSFKDLEQLFTNLLSVIVASTFGTYSASAKLSYHIAREMYDRIPQDLVSQIQWSGFEKEAHHWKVRDDVAAYVSRRPKLEPKNFSFGQGSLKIALDALREENPPKKVKFKRSLINKGLYHLRELYKKIDPMFVRGLFVAALGFGAVEGAGAIGDYLKELGGGRVRTEDQIRKDNLREKGFRPPTESSPANNPNDPIRKKMTVFTVLPNPGGKIAELPIYYDTASEAQIKKYGKPMKLPKKVEDSFGILSKLPVYATDEGYLSLFYPQGYELSDLAIYRYGYEFPIRNKFEILRSTKDRVLGVRFLDPKLIGDTETAYMIRSSFHKSRVKSATLGSEFQELVPEALKATIKQLRAEGFRQLADGLDLLFEDDLPISIRNIEEIIKGFSTYTYRQAGFSLSSWFSWDPFGEYQKFIIRGCFYAQCDGGNGLGKDFVNLYQENLEKMKLQPKGYDSIEARNIFTFLRDPKSQFVPLANSHLRTRVFSKDKNKWIDLDMTPMMTDRGLPPVPIDDSVWFHPWTVADRRKSLSEMLVPETKFGPNELDNERRVKLIQKAKKLFIDHPFVKSSLRDSIKDLPAKNALKMISTLEQYSKGNLSDVAVKESFKRLYSSIGIDPMLMDVNEVIARIAEVELSRMRALHERVKKQYSGRFNILKQQATMETIGSLFHSMTASDWNPVIPVHECQRIQLLQHLNSPNRL